MTTTTLQSVWQALTGPTVNGLGGSAQGAGSVRTSATQGVTQTSDGQSVIVWNGTQAQYYDTGTGTWSAVATLTAGTQPACWSSVYHGRALFWDITRDTWVSLDFTTGRETLLSSKAQNWDCQNFPSPSSTRYRLGVTPSIWCDPRQPGLASIAYQDLFGVSILMLVNFQGVTPRVVALRKFTDSQFIIYGVGCNGYVEPNPIAGGNNAIIPGAILRRPGIGQPGSPTDQYGDLFQQWTVLTYGLISVPVPWFTFYDGSTALGLQAITQTNAATWPPLTPTPSLFCNTPSTFRAFVQTLASSFAYTAANTASYARVIRSGLSVSQVAHQPFNLQNETLGLPLTVAGPTLNATSWALLNPGNVPYLLDADGRFYRLAFAQYENVQKSLHNWTWSL